ncbi:MAG TPA: YjzC family protein [Leptolyngbyaceae cyanobacterium]
MRIGDSHVYRPGEIVPISGQYRAVTDAGEKTARTVTCERDNRFPAVSSSVYGFLLSEQFNQDSDAQSKKTG